MRNFTTCLDARATESAYASYYPSVVVSAHRLMMRSKKSWPSRSSAFLLLVKRGCEGADAHLRTLRLSQPDQWVTMTLDDRVRSAVLMACLAMERHLLSEAADRT